MSVNLWPCTFNETSREPTPVPLSAVAGYADASRDEGGRDEASTNAEPTRRIAALAPTSPSASAHIFTQSESGMADPPPTLQEEPEMVIDMGVSEPSHALIEAQLARAEAAAVREELEEARRKLQAALEETAEVCAEIKAAQRKAEAEDVASAAQLAQEKGRADSAETALSVEKASSQSLEYRIKAQELMLDKAVTNLAAAKRSERSLEEDLKTLQGVRYQAVVESATLTQELVVARQGLQAYATQVTNLHSELTQTQQTLDSVRDAHTHDQEAYEKDRHEQNVEAARLSSEGLILKQERDKLSAERDRYSNRLEASLKERSADRKLFDQGQVAYEELKKELEKREETLNMTKNRLNELEKDNASMGERLVQQESQLSAMEQKVREMKDLIKRILLTTM
jgi:chromosome segregation ATPase